MVNSEYLDHMMVPSVEYIDLCANQLHADKAKFHTLCFGVPDLYEKYKNIKTSNTVLSIGRSNRDFDWLIREWKNIDYPLVIISDSYSPPKDLSSNITIKNNVSGDEQYPYIMKSRIVVLPIDDPTICSGDTVLLTAMSFKKTVIVTAPSTLSEMYVKDGKNGFTVSKKNGVLKKCIENAFSNEEIGEKARASYEKNFSRLKMGIQSGEMIAFSGVSKVRA